MMIASEELVVSCFAAILSLGKNDIWLVGRRDAVREAWTV